MKELDEAIKLQILQTVSAGYLTEPLPDDWHELSEEEQETFLRNNAWEPFEYWPEWDVYEAILALTYNVEKLIQEQ